MHHHLEGTLLGAEAPDHVVVATPRTGGRCLLVAGQGLLGLDPLALAHLVLVRHPLEADHAPHNRRTGSDHGAPWTGAHLAQQRRGQKWIKNSAADHSSHQGFGFYRNYKSG